MEREDGISGQWEGEKEDEPDRDGSTEKEKSKVTKKV